MSDATDQRPAGRTDPLLRTRAGHDARSSADDDANTLLLWLVAALVALLHVMIEGYSVGYGNHSIHLPLMKSYFHPELFPGDPMIATRDHFVSYYFIALAALVEGVGHLEPIFFGLHLAAETLCVVAIVRLAEGVRAGSGWIAAALYCGTPPALAFPVFYSNYHTHAAAAQAMVLWCLFWFVAGHRRRAYALLGLAFNVHALSAAHAAAMFGAASVASLRRTGPVETARQLALFAVVASPALLWILASAAGPMPAGWLEQLRARSAHHSFPLSWEFGRLLEYLLFAATGAFCAWRVVEARDCEERDRSVFWMAVGVVSLCGVGFLFSEWFPNETVLRAQLFRSTKWLSILVIVYAAAWLADAFARQRRWPLPAAAFFVLFFAGEPGALPVVIALALLVLHWLWIRGGEAVGPVSGRRDRALRAGFGVATASAIIAAALAPAPEIGSGLLPATRLLGRITARPQTLATAALLSVALLAWSRPRFWEARSRNARLVATGALGLAILGLSFSLYDREHPPLEKRNAWVRVQLWAKQNSRPGTVFLTPPHKAGFRVFSERSSFVEWKDGTMQYFDKEFSAEWWARMQRLGGMDGPYGELGVPQLASLRADYRIDYAVFATPKELPLSLVYESKEYRIFDLGALTPENR